MLTEQFDRWVEDQPEPPAHLRHDPYKVAHFWVTRAAIELERRQKEAVETNPNLDHLESFLAAFGTMLRDFDIDTSEPEKVDA